MNQQCTACACVQPKAYLFEAAVHLKRQNVRVEGDESEFVLSEHDAVEDSRHVQLLLQQVHADGELLRHEVHVEGRGQA
jgi:hypothetical protein